MGISKWLFAVGAAVAASGVQAGDQKAMAYIAPYAGYTHIRIDEGRVFDELDTIRFDSLQVGATFGFRAPFGLLAEVGHGEAVHADIFDDHGDYGLESTYGAVGWRIPFAESWVFTPKVGRGRWELSSDHRVLLDDAGERHYEITGWDNFFELALERQINDRVSLGVQFKDVDQEFGHARSGTFVANFSF